MLKKCLAILLCFAVMLPLSVCFTASAAGTSSYRFDVDTENTGDVIGNKVSNMNLWSLDSLQSYTTPDPTADCSDFVDYIQIMTATGGNSDRDLFLNPDDLSVLDDYDFSSLINACHTILRYGAKPLIKLGNVPRKLSDGYSVGNFGVNVYPPLDYSVYYNYIKDIAQALLDEFGAEEVQSWRFGVLTEYENSDWFMAKDGSAASSCEAYCKLYDYSVAALQDVLGTDVFVGAHSMTVTEGLWDERDFIRHCALGTNYKTGTKGTRLCYLSTSFYDTTPEKRTSGKTLAECIDFLRNYAESVGLTGLVYGVDEGRINSGVNSGASGKDLLSRSVGHNWQGAYDTFTLSQMVENDIDYFSSWGYTTNGAWGGISTQSFHVADCFNKLFTGKNKASVTKTYSGTNDMVSASAAWSDESNSLAIMAYNMNYSLNYSNDASMQYSVSVPSLASTTVKVSAYRIDSDSNFFDEWWTDRNTYGITDNKFNWSPDDYCIENPTVLADESARQTYFSRRDYYKTCATLTPTESYAYVGADGKVQLNDTITANTAVFYLITPTDGTTLSKDSSGNYVISNEKDLRLFASMVNGGKSFSGETVVLLQDISLADGAWTPIGTESSPFKGTFDGNGHVISGLSYTATSSNHLGFFSYVTGAVIRNLGIENAYFHGNMENAIFIGVCNGVTIDQCYLKGGTVKSELQSSAAFIASATGTGNVSITNCWSDSSVIVKPSDTGNGWSGSGFIAWVGSSGSVNIQNCYYTGNLTVNPDHHGGAFFGGSSGLTTAYLSNCFTTFVNIYGNPSASSFGVNGTAGTVSADALKNKASGLGSAFSSDIIGINDGYPVLAYTIASTAYSLNADGVYEISSENQLRRLAYEVNNGNTYSGATFELTNDIVMSSKSFTPIGGNGGTSNMFSGTFNGNGFTIQNLTINSSTYNAALFGFASNATIENLKLLLPTVKGTESVAALVGQAYGTSISNCCVAWGEVRTTSGGSAGGIVARAYGTTTITNCFNLSSIFLYAGNWYVGGIAGLNGGTLTITNCYSANSLSAADQGVNYRGGILGGNNSGTVSINNSYSINSYPLVGSSGGNGVTQTSCATGNEAYIKGRASALGSAFMPDYKNIQIGYPVLAYDHEHTLKTITTPAGCTTSGSKATVCADCGEQLSVVTLDPIGHVWNNGVVTTTPTCTESGVKTFTCTACNAEKTETISATGHKSQSVSAVAPGCTTKGAKAYTYCSVCKCVLTLDGEEYTGTVKTKDAEFTALIEVASTGHTWDSGKVTTAPSCTADGVKTFTCTSCSEIITESIDKLGHNYVAVVTPPTCTAGGYTTHTCSRCSDSYTDTTVAATGHTWDSGNVTTNPTCTADGVKTFTCTICSEIRTESIDKLGHNYTAAVTLPTCTKDGYTTYTCTRCSDSYIDNSTDALGHDYSEWVVTVAPTCTTSGQKQAVCVTCGDVITETIVPTGHASQSVNAVAPGCTTKGAKAYTYCSVCKCVLTLDGDEYTGTVKTTDAEFAALIEVAAVGHTWDSGKITTAPSCTEDGVKTFTCTSCSETRTENIDKLGHNYVAVITPPTCTVDGYTTHTCSHCSDSYTDTPTTATGHTWDNGKITTAPTCTADGVKTFTCTSCSETRTENIDKLGHNYEETVTPPTCTVDGYTTHTCTRCSDSYTDTTVAATGHTWDNGKITTAPTCTADGVKTFTCTKCQGTRTESIDKLGHIYEETVTPPTCTVDGYTTHTCTRCSDSYTDTTVAATGHIDSDKNGLCDVCGSEITERQLTLWEKIVAFFRKIINFFKSIFGGK